MIWFHIFGLVNVLSCLEKLKAQKVSCKQNEQVETRVDIWQSVFVERKNVNVEVKGGIFQFDNFSPLLFVLCMVLLSLTLQKVKFNYEFVDKNTRLNHLLFMDDLKLFAKSHDQTIHWWIQYIRLVRIMGWNLG